MCKDIYVVIEQRDGNVQKVGLELLSEATRLAESLEQAQSLLMQYESRL